MKLDAWEQYEGSIESVIFVSGLLYQGVILLLSILD